MNKHDRWNKENSLCISLRVMRSTEADIIRRLEAEENKSAYLKSLIREDIKRKELTSWEPKPNGRT